MNDFNKTKTAISTNANYVFLGLSHRRLFSSIHPGDGLGCWISPKRWAGLLDFTQEMGWAVGFHPRDGQGCWIFHSFTQEMGWAVGFSSIHPRDGLGCWISPKRWAGLLDFKDYTHICRHTVLEP